MPLTNLSTSSGSLLPRESRIITPSASVVPVVLAEAKAPQGPNGYVRNKMQEARFEMKYIIDDERKIDRIRDFILSEGILRPDKYSADKIGLGYEVISLYLDSRRFQTYLDTEQGIPNRHKVRIRLYDEDPGSPCFLQVKSRRDHVISKTQAGVSKQSGNYFLWTGDYLIENHLLHPSQEEIEGLYNFNRYCQRYNAEPAAWTYYHREGFETPAGNEQRITFDRLLRRGVYDPKNGLGVWDREDWPMVQRPGDVVLELKWSSRPELNDSMEPPKWMLALIRTFQLQRGAMQKYVVCLEGNRPDLAR